MIKSYSSIRNRNVLEGVESKEKQINSKRVFRASSHNSSYSNLRTLNERDIKMHQTFTRSEANTKLKGISKIQRPNIEDTINRYLIIPKNESQSIGIQTQIFNSDNTTLDESAYICVKCMQESEQAIRRSNEEKIKCLCTCKIDLLVNSKLLTNIKKQGYVVSLAKSLLNQLLKQFEQSTNSSGRSFIKLIKEVITQYEESQNALQTKFDQTIKKQESNKHNFDEEISKLKSAYESKIEEINNKLDEVMSESEKVKREISSYKNLPSIKEFNELMDINLTLRNNVEILEKDLKYAKLNENKLLYLFFCAQESGYPITKIYDKIKKIPIEKFEMLIESNNSMHSVIHKRKKSQFSKHNNLTTSSIIEYESQPSSSYMPIAEGEPLRILKPEIVNTLDLEMISQYHSSSTEHNSSSYEFVPPLLGAKDTHKKSISKIEGSALNMFASNKYLSSINPKSETDCEIDRYSIFDAKYDI